MVEIINEQEVNTPVLKEQEIVSNVTASVGYQNYSTYNNNQYNQYYPYNSNNNSNYNYYYPTNNTYNYSNQYQQYQYPNSYYAYNQYDSNYQQLPQSLPTTAAPSITTNTNDSSSLLSVSSSSSSSSSFTAPQSPQSPVKKTTPVANKSKKSKKLKSSVDNETSTTKDDINQTSGPIDLSLINIDLSNICLWEKFHQHTTEMIITKQGRLVLNKC
jgi:hypothetical protein